MLKRLPSAENPFIENYAIILKAENNKDERVENGQMIGVIGIPRLSHDGMAAEVGYGIRPDFWGRGYASEALILFVKHYFSSERRLLLSLIFLTFPSGCCLRRTCENVAARAREEANK
jgi:RimJ/RimL family protein N-acetyltransferase